jgi:hypothetical protein
MPNTAKSAPAFSPFGNNSGVALCVQSGSVICLHKDLQVANSNATSPWVLSGGTGLGHGNINLCPIPTGANSLVFWPAWVGSDPTTSPTLMFYGRLRGGTPETTIDPVLAPNAGNSNFNPSSGDRRWIRLYNEASGATTFTPNCATPEYSDSGFSCGPHDSVNLLGCDQVMAVCSVAAVNPTATILQGIFIQ